MFLGWGEAFDGVGEHRSGHCGGVILKEGEQAGFVAFAHLAEHPTCGFVNKRMWVGEVFFGDFDGGLEMVASDKHQSGDDGDALFPKVFAFAEAGKDCFVGGVIYYPLAEDVGAERSTRSQLLARRALAR